MRPADAARAAFAIGWAKATARHPVQLTERGRLACLAAMAVAEASPQPGNAPTLQLGQLEGIWAVVYARREAIEQLHGQALADVLKAISGLDWSQVLDQIRQSLLLDPNMSRAQLAGRLGNAVEQLIGNDLPVDQAQAWRTVMNQALIDATAEGQTAALALVGQAGNVTISFDLAAADAKAALAGDRVLWDQSSGWMAKQAHGLGYQVSQKLASLWADDASREDMEQAIADILGATRNNASLILDQAVGQAISTGALDTYGRAGVQYVDFVTAGDGRVCPACDEAEDDNSYQLEQVPAPPLHVGCRCTLSPSDYQPTQAALTLLAPYQDIDDEEADAA